MQDQRDGNYFTNGAQTLEIQLRRAFIQAVRCADGNRKRIYAGSLDKFLGLLWVGERIAVAAFKVILFAADLAQLSFHADAGRSTGLDDAAGQCNVVLEGIV